MNDIPELIERLRALAGQLRGSSRSTEAQWCEEGAEALEARGEISEARVAAVRERLHERGYTEISHFAIDLVLRHAAALSSHETKSSSDE